jgi:ribosomal 50S subunit-recycling heat shock protein
MRLDLVLKLSGIIKRRTIAKAVAENGHIKINGKVAKPSSDVKEKDQLTLFLGSKTIEVVITYIQKGKKEYPVFEQINKETNDSEA